MSVKRQLRFLEIFSDFHASHRILDSVFRVLDVRSTEYVENVWRDF